MDYFDCIKSALWRFKDEHRAVQIGVIWENSWTYQTYINKSNKEDKTGGHALAVIGWKDKDYLIIQNSIGKEIGENGIQYIHRDIINANKQFGALMFADMPTDLTREEILKKSKYYRSNLWQKIILLLADYLKDIFS